MDDVLRGYNYFVSEKEVKAESCHDEFLSDYNVPNLAVRKDFREEVYVA